MGLVQINNATLNLADGVGAGRVVIGQDGAGTLFVNDGGAVTADSLQLGTGADLDSKLSIASASGSATVSGATDVGAADNATAEITVVGEFHHQLAVDRRSCQRHRQRHRRSDRPPGGQRRPDRRLAHKPSRLERELNITSGGNVTAQAIGVFSEIGGGAGGDSKITVTEIAGSTLTFASLTIGGTVASVDVTQQGNATSTPAGRFPPPTSMSPTAEP